MSNPRHRHPSLLKPAPVDVSESLPVSKHSSVTLIEEVRGLFGKSSSLFRRSLRLGISLMAILASVHFYISILLMDNPGSGLSVLVAASTSTRPKLGVAHYVEDMDQTSSVNVLNDFIPSRRLKYAIVYIAGRDPNSAGDLGIIDQLHLSVFSACYTAEKRHQINFVIFVSDLDHRKCASSSHFDDECIYSRIEHSCHTVLPQAKFTYAPMDDVILNWWHEHLGIVSFYHHSTWFGYTKLWLPNLLEKNYSKILFVDTDTVWNKPPSVIFNELDHFNSTQVVGASSLMNGHPQSKSFWNRVTSGILLMDLQKLSNSMNWTRILANSIVSNRGGIEAGEKIPVTYNRSSHCEDAHWGLFSKPLCLSIPYFDSADCETSRTCWMAREGDQEFFSNIFTNFHPELLYQLPSEHQCIVMHNVKVGEGIVCNNATLMHAPKFEKLLANKKYLTAFSKILPRKMYESVRLFIRQIDSDNELPVSTDKQI